MEDKDKDKYEINLVLDKDRYHTLLDICVKYKEQQGVELTPKEYILMLIDSAIKK
ncbi:MAG: hypothetical protein WA395_02645 [Nitrososphaeraceae archaeon]|jgi:hypothetical protein